jgi:quercetin dioxygenase-like cupin family protein
MDSDSKPIRMFRLIERATCGLNRFQSHVTILRPGAGYPQHADSYDVAVALLSGRVETLDRIVDAPAAIYYDRGDLHGLRNVGDTPARYVVFELESSIDVRRSGDETTHTIALHPHTAESAV